MISVELIVDEIVSAIENGVAAASEIGQRVRFSLTISSIGKESSRRIVRRHV